MSLLKKSPVLLAFVLLFFFTACTLSFADTQKAGTSFKDVKKETRELLDTLKTYSSEQRDETLHTIQKGLKKVDHRIDMLEARIDQSWGKMKDSARKEARQSLQTLRKQRTKVAEWYGSLKSGSGKAWQEIKDGFSNAYGELHKAWEHAEHNSPQA